MKVFALYSIKGGVGKTASAVNLAYLSALEGARTLIWDLDPQGAASFYFRVRPGVRSAGKRIFGQGRQSQLGQLIRGTDFEALDMVPADFSYRMMDLQLDAGPKPKQRIRELLAPLAADYDHVFLDCAPSISLASESVFGAADVLLVPVIPTPLSLRTLEQLTGHLEGRRGPRVRVLPFWSLVDRRKRLHRETCADPDLDARYGLLRQSVPYSSKVEQMGLRRAPVLTYAGSDVASHAYEALWWEILERLEI